MPVRRRAATRFIIIVCMTIAAMSCAGERRREPFAGLRAMTGGDRVVSVEVSGDTAQLLLESSNKSLRREMWRQVADGSITGLATGRVVLSPEHAKQVMWTSMLESFREVQRLRFDIPRNSPVNR